MGHRGRVGTQPQSPPSIAGRTVSIRRLRIDGMIAYRGRPPRGFGRWRATDRGEGWVSIPDPRGGVRRRQRRDAQRPAGRNGRQEEHRMVDRGTAPAPQRVLPCAQQGVPGASTGKGAVRCQGVLVAWSGQSHHQEVCLLLYHVWLRVCIDLGHSLNGM